MFSLPFCEREKIPHELASPDYFEELSVIKPCGDSYENASDSNPKSDPDTVIDAAAKRILEEYRDAFTELAKGSDD